MSRYMASSLGGLVVGYSEPTQTGRGVATYRWMYGLCFNDSRNHDSARRSPVCRTAPLEPSTRNLNRVVKGQTDAMKLYHSHDGPRTVISVE